MAKDNTPDVPPTPPPPAPSERLTALRSKIAELQARVKDLTVSRVEPSAENDQKGYVLAKWGRTRVAQIVEGKITIDEAECLVCEVAIAHLTVS